MAELLLRGRCCAELGALAPSPADLGKLLVGLALAATRKDADGFGARMKAAAEAAIRADTSQTGH
ncbi:hypothetical protein OG762_49495 (plasmid) [Streptomyces sp. NBC_01136]|uniref:hypothetical protein n=1 Tax=unclassified Streptomyces TaxID=2593676 RepID=UPI002F914B77|nr:hypothetical protein OG762_49495 [Streptomyces sp. NBC_01136]